MTEAVETIERARGAVPARRGLLVAITGIDGSGKGYLAARIAEALGTRAGRVAILNVDAWLNLPHVRFDTARPAEHFYRHAIRFDEMFSTVVLPLRDRRSIRVEANLGRGDRDRVSTPPTAASRPRSRGAKRGGPRRRPSRPTGPSTSPLRRSTSLATPREARRPRASRTILGHVP